MRKLLPLVLFAASSLFAQTPDHSFRLVTPNGPSAVVIHTGPDLHLINATLYDGNPSAVFIRDHANIQLSYFLFPNKSRAPTAESCRDAIIANTLLGMKDVNLKDEQRSTRKMSDGSPLAIETYLIPQLRQAPLQQENVWGFSGSTEHCAGLHLTRTSARPADHPLVEDAQEIIDGFTYDPAYVPVSNDYAVYAFALFSSRKYQESVVYYKRAAETLPVDSSIVLRRVLIDQLSISYGMSGDLKHSREVNETAILKDPDYPIYYYNLACADAESGDATAARTHLQQAFDRRANTIKGETLPDPTRDDSILKLKSDKTFWAFVESLSGSNPRAYL